MIDVTGVVVVELRDAPSVRAIVGQHGGTWKVRGDEPGPGWEPPLVTVTWLSNDRSPWGPNTGRLGLIHSYLSVKCAGTSPEQAIQLYGAVSDVLHHKRVRVGTSGRLLFLTVDDSAAMQTSPEARWAYVDATVVVTAAAQAVA